MRQFQNQGVLFSLPMLCLGLLLFLAMPASAQNGKISGRLQRNGNPLEFVVIKLQDGEGCQLNAQMTDEYGAFEFKHLEPGVYGLVGEFQGFPIHAKVNLGQDAHVMISLTPSVFRWVPATLKSQSNRSLYTYADGGMCYVQRVGDNPLDGLPTKRSELNHEFTKSQTFASNGLPSVRQGPLGALVLIEGTPCNDRIPPLVDQCLTGQTYESGIPAEFGGGYAYVFELR